METAIKTSRWTRLANPANINANADVHRDSGAKRAFQSLPRHLRRRAASHNIRRLPKRLRAKAKFEVMHEQTRSLKKRKFRQLPIAKRRKLLKFGRMQILHHRQSTCTAPCWSSTRLMHCTAGNKAWLETHIWHAKRMKMVDTWGYRLVCDVVDGLMLKLSGFVTGGDTDSQVFSTILPCGNAWSYRTRCFVLSDYRATGHGWRPDSCPRQNLRCDSCSSVFEALHVRSARMPDNLVWMRTIPIRTDWPGFNYLECCGSRRYSADATYCCHTLSS